MHPSHCQGEANRPNRVRATYRGTCWKSRPGQAGPRRSGAFHGTPSICWPRATFQRCVHPAGTSRPLPKGSAGIISGPWTISKTRRILLLRLLRPKSLPPRPSGVKGPLLSSLSYPGHPASTCGNRCPGQAERRTKGRASVVGGWWHASNVRQSLIVWPLRQNRPGRRLR